MVRTPMMILAAVCCGGVLFAQDIAQRPYRAGGDVKPPIVIKRVKPVFTETARKARVTGIVIVETVIDKKGIVRDVKILKPLPFGLDQAAAEAVRQWRFRPATRYGRPVDVIFEVTIPFRP